jgi:hypothetical protein
MELEDLRKIESELNNIDYSNYTDYSGRGMGGKETCGIVVEPEDEYEVQRAIGRAGLDIHTRVDNMGKRIIIY